MSKKTKIIIISCSIVLILLIISTIIAISPFTTVNNVLSDKTSKLIGNNGFIYKQDKIVLSKFDLINPVYTRVFDISNDSKGEKLGFIYQLKRKNLFEFEVVEPVGSFSAKNLTFEEVKTITNKYDLRYNNPDSKNISAATGSEDRKVYDSEEEFFSFKKEFTASVNLNEIADLKKGQNIKEVSLLKTLPIRYDSSKSPSIPPYQLAYNKNNISFIALNFDDNTIDNPNAKLDRVVVVKTDRSFIEVPTKPDGTFDLDNYAN